MLLIKASIPRTRQMDHASSQFLTDRIGWLPASVAMGQRGRALPRISVRGRQQSPHVAQRHAHEFRSLPAC